MTLILCWPAEGGHLYDLDPAVIVRAAGVISVHRLDNELERCLTPGSLSLYIFTSHGCSKPRDVHTKCIVRSLGASLNVLLQVIHNTRNSNAFLLQRLSCLVTSGSRDGKLPSPLFLPTVFPFRLIYFQPIPLFSIFPTAWPTHLVLGFAICPFPLFLRFNDALGILIRAVNLWLSDC